jgi:hypothetical protein
MATLVVVVYALRLFIMVSISYSSHHGSARLEMSPSSSSCSLTPSRLFTHVQLGYDQISLLRGSFPFSVARRSSTAVYLSSELS